MHPAADRARDSVGRFGANVSSRCIVNPRRDLEEKSFIIRHRNPASQEAKAQGPFFSQCRTMRRWGQWKVARPRQEPVWS